MSGDKKKAIEEARTALLATWDDAVEQIVQDSRRMMKNDSPQFVQDWLKRLMDYTVPGGKMNRALAVSDSLQILKGRPLDENETRATQILGWCIEIMQAFFLVADDLMDSSVTRRGQPCWYRLPGIGTVAENDAFLLESIMYRLLELNFKNEPWYMEMQSLIHEVVYQTALGQLLDLTSLNQGPRKESNDLSHFTLEAYLRIIKFKTVCYSFYLPISIALVAHGVKDRSVFDVTFDVCVEMGSYFQIQDDFLDCFGDPKLIGKIGTDIQEKKLTWLVATCLPLLTSEERATFEKHYGLTDDASVKLIKDFYARKEIPRLFREFEDESYAKLTKMIDGVTCIPKEVFSSFLEKIYKRTK